MKFLTSQSRNFHHNVLCEIIELGNARYLSVSRCNVMCFEANGSVQDFRLEQTGGKILPRCFCVFGCCQQVHSKHLTKYGPFDQHLPFFCWGFISCFLEASSTMLWANRLINYLDMLMLSLLCCFHTSVTHNLAMSQTYGRSHPRNGKWSIMNMNQILGKNGPTC